MSSCIYVQIALRIYNSFLYQKYEGGIFMDKRVTYTHFGHTKFDKENFKEIKNRPMCIKPSGGFWASRTDAKYGWKEWNENNCFSACNNNHRVFRGRLD